MTSTSDTSKMTSCHQGRMKLDELRLRLLDFVLQMVSCIKDLSLDPIFDASTTQKSNVSWPSSTKENVAITQEPRAWRIVYLLPGIIGQQCRPTLLITSKKLNDAYGSPMPPIFQQKWPHSFTLAIHEFRYGHFRKTLRCSKTTSLHPSSHKLFHEMD